MIVLILAVLASVGAIVYIMRGRSAALASEKLQAALDAESAIKLASFNKWCADHNLNPAAASSQYLLGTQPWLTA